MLASSRQVQLIRLDFCFHSHVCDSVLSDQEASGLLRFVTEVYQYVNPYSKRPEEGHRLVGTTIVGELVLHIENDATLLANAMNAMLARMGDESKYVRLRAIRGAGHLASAPSDEVNRFATPVISALMGFVESDNEDLVLESLDALAKVCTSLLPLRISLGLHALSLVVLHLFICMFADI